MVCEPAGPVYLCYDALLQETPLTDEVAIPGPDTAKAPAPMAADPGVLAQIVDRLLTAERPYIMAEFTGRQPGNFEKLVELAELLGVAVWDVNSALCFPNRHPQNLSMDTDALAKADAILALDVVDWEKATAKLDSTTRRVESFLAEGCEWMEVGFHETGISSWSLDYGRSLPKRLSALGDPRLAMPQMIEVARARLADDAALADRVEARKSTIASRHAENFARWAEQAQTDRDASPLTTARLAQEVWDVIRDEDWVLGSGTLRQWTRKLWDFDALTVIPARGLAPRPRSASRWGWRWRTKAATKWSLRCSPTVT